MTHSAALCYSVSMPATETTPARKLVKVTGWVEETFAEQVKAEAKSQKRTVSFAVGEGLKLWLSETDTEDKP